MTDPLSTYRPDLDEVRQFREQFPDIRQVDVLIADAAGILRGKKMPAERLEYLFTKGVYFPGSVFAINIEGETVESTGLGMDEGDADRICLPIPNTLDPIPWAPRPTGQVMLRMFDHDGTPFFPEPRAVLERVTKRLKARGLTPVAAIESEFYLVDLERGRLGEPRPPLSPITGKRQGSTQVYGIDELYDFDGLLAEIYEACQAQEIPVDSVVSEYAPGQYEVNLHHVKDPMEACDDAILLKRAIKAVALKHGVEATFMAKPYPNQVGSGMHIHLSLEDEEGNNIFAAEHPGGSKALGHVIAGMAQTMGEGLALFAPNQNSYRRFERYSYAPQSAAWAINNRSAALRVPPGDARNRRVEHRVTGADANPYLVMAAVLAGAEYGLAHELEPAAPIEGNAYDLELPRFTSSWLAAIEALEESDFYREALGDDFIRTYTLMKRDERERVFSTITPLEYELYLSKA